MKKHFKEKLVTKSLGLLAVLSLLVFNISQVKAQTDTEFWFVVPDITYGHNAPGGVPSALKFSSSNLPATVTISMPAGDPLVFPDITVELAPFDFQVVSLDAWIVSGGGDVNPTLLENKAITPDGINNFGLHITSTAPITAYYEVNNYNNKDIWALKGKNGLGLEFFTPFQNQSDNGSYTPSPYSAIDVVATEDGTDVTFTLPPNKGASYGTGPETDIAPTAAGSTLTVTLNRGQTFSLSPLNRSTAAGDRLAGTKIESSKPIAVTIKDDSHLHTSGGCKDVSGDQLIPSKVWDKETATYKDLIGKEYIAIRTALENQDNLFILPVEDNTNIMIYDPAGIEVANETRNARDQYHRALPSGTAYYHIVADKPVYVMHIGGFGCEVGAAILPPVEKCTGVPRVAFARTSTEDFYVVVMVRKGAENSFEFDGGAEDVLFPPGNFQEVDGSDWSVARFGPFNTTQIPVGTHFMQNTEDIFHLGIVNGGSSSGCFYGYFSDFNELKASGVVAGTSSQFIQTCFGETVQLYASGGTQYKWYENEFDPAVSLNDDEIQNPFANPTTNTNYKVVVSGACNMKDSAYIEVKVSDYINADFAVNKDWGTSPFEVEITDNSEGVYSWQYDMGDGSNKFIWDMDSTSENPEPNNPFKFTQTFFNSTNDPIDFEITLYTLNIDSCESTFKKVVTVYPEVTKKHTLTIGINPNDGGSATGAGEYELEQEISLNALPNSGFLFENWSIGEEIISTESTFPFTMPDYDVTIIANFKPITFVVTFNITDALGNSISNATTVLNGIQNDSGIYYYSSIAPGTYTYIVSHQCSPKVEGEITVTNADISEQVMINPLLGDANGDEWVNVTDITILVGHILETYNGKFCFYNADVIADDVINIQDMVETASIIMSEKGKTISDVKSESAEIFLSSDGISLKSDGTITGIQLELTGINEALPLELLATNHHLAHSLNNNKIVALIFNPQNQTIPAGEIELLSFSQINTLPKWGKVIAVNSSSDIVPLETHIISTTFTPILTELIDLKVYPNPVKGRLNITFNNQSPQPVVISLATMQGIEILTKEVLERDQIKTTFDITNFPSGAYILSINYNGQIINRLIIVQK